MEAIEPSMEIWPPAWGCAAGFVAQPATATTRESATATRALIELADMKPPMRAECRSRVRPKAAPGSVAADRSHPGCASLTRATLLDALLRVLFRLADELLQHLLALGRLRQTF